MLDGPIPSPPGKRGRLYADRDQLAEFINRLYRHAEPGGYVSLRSFYDKGSRKAGSEVFKLRAVQINGHGLEPVIEAATVLANECANATDGVVFCPPIATFRGSKASASELQEGLSVSVECDESPATARSNLEHILGPATIVIESGGIWVDPSTGEVHPKLHLHWCLDEPARTPQDHQSLMRARRIATRIAGADPTNIATVHPIRWPGSWHRKGAPRMARIIASSDHEINLADALEVLDDIAECQNLFARDESREPSREPTAALQDIVAALSAMCNASDWEDWNRVGMAAWRASGGHPHAFAAWDNWSRQSPKYDAEITDQRWQHYRSSPPTSLGCGTLFHRAKLDKPGWRKPSLSTRQQEPPAYEENDFPSENIDMEPTRKQQKPKRRIEPPIDVGEDIEAIPPREWVLGNSYCRGFLSSIIAPGGVGKTSLRIVQALSICTGRPLTGEHVFHRGRVLIICLEDDLIELRRRVRAAMRHYQILPADAAGRLFIAAPIGEKIAISQDGMITEGDLAQYIRDQVEECAIDVVMLDPAIKAHEGDENSNGEMDKFATILTRLAIDLNISLDIAHHASKGISDPGNADKARGASSFKDAGRLLYTLSQMSPEEAQTLGIPNEERRSLVRLDSGKVNIAPPIDSAMWFKIVGVPLGNGTEAYPHGDTIGVVEPWEAPDLWQKIPSVIANRILDDIEKGLPLGVRYSGAPSAKARAAWPVVVFHVPDLVEKQARQVIATWKKNKVLFDDDYHNPDRREMETGLFVDATKRPS